MLLQPLFARLFPGRSNSVTIPLPPGKSPPKLGRREREVLQKMAKGHSKKEIAEHLFISPNTVRKHFNNLYAKLETDSPQEAVVKAVAFGLLPLDFTVARMK